MDKRNKFVPQAFDRLSRAVTLLHVGNISSAYWYLRPRRENQIQVKEASVSTGLTSAEVVPASGFTSVPDYITFTLRGTVHASNPTAGSLPGAIQAVHQHIT